jgi:hypothetical protein
MCYSSAIFADSGAESAYGTIWSSSPCITRTGTVDLLQVFGEVRLGEGDDAVIVRLGASHHTLAPPIQMPTKSLDASKTVLNQGVFVVSSDRL